MEFKGFTDENPVIACISKDTSEWNAEFCEKVEEETDSG